MLSPSERSLRSRIASYRKWANTSDPSAATAAARAKFLERFLDEVDPERVLPEAERERRALAARKAYFAQLAYKSARVRSRRKGLADAA